MADTRHDMQWTCMNAYNAYHIFRNVLIPDAPTRQALRAPSATFWVIHESRKRQNVVVRLNVWDILWRFNKHAKYAAVHSIMLRISLLLPWASDARAVGLISVDIFNANDAVFMKRKQHIQAKLVVYQIFQPFVAQKQFRLCIMEYICKYDMGTMYYCAES